MHRTPLIAALKFMASLALLGLGAGAGAAELTQPSQTGQSVGSPDRFGSYEENFAIWQRMQNNGWAANDASALRGHYSFKYTVCGPRLIRGDKIAPVRGTVDTGGLSLCPKSGTLANAELFLAYAGEFDFYLGTRPSGPVINRISTPGIFVRLPATWLVPNAQDGDSVELGWQHRSDGQTTEIGSARDARIANENYAAGNVPFFDTISRGANFFSIAVDRVGVFSQSALSLRAKLKLYAGTQDADVTWGPRAGLGSRFSDYDRLLLTGTYSFSKQTLVELEWRLGDKGLATDSWTLNAQVLWADLPLYLRLHRGPMNTLSNYTQRQDSVGFGLRFAHF